MEKTSNKGVLLADLQQQGGVEGLDNDNTAGDDKKVVCDETVDDDKRDIA